jgi:triosephosphate isomerase (TIM)
MPRAWPRRPRFVAGNWKMHTTQDAAAGLAREVATGAREIGAALALCPPFTALAAVGPLLSGTEILLGAQNLHPEPQGAFTGEIAGPMLVALGCRCVIVGHSERRHGMGEDDALVARKQRAALRDGLMPIVCVGETLAEREAGTADAVLARQVEAAFGGLPAEGLAASVIAYEPVWAIGTGKVASPEQAAAAHRTIRATLDRVAGPGAGASVAVLYGGSVNAKNAAALFAEEELDGALVGGASLEAASFLAIAKAARGA